MFDLTQIDKRTNSGVKDVEVWIGDHKVGVAQSVTKKRNVVSFEDNSRIYIL